MRHSQRSNFVHFFLYLVTVALVVFMWPCAALAFNVGSRVQAVGGYSIRTSAAGAKTGYFTVDGTKGTVLAGPTYAYLAETGLWYNWYNVNWDSGQDGWSIEASMTASATKPATPTNPTPGSTSSPGTMLSSNNVTLSWDASSGATYYDLGVTDVATGALVVDTTTNSPSYTTTLAAGKAYRWNVAAGNTAGLSSYTSLRYFQTPAGQDGDFYLRFPLSGQTHLSATINSVFDHSMSSSYSKDDIVVAYDDERGEKRFGSDGSSSPGYKMDPTDPDGPNFYINGNYAGAGTPYFLNYDGHPGIDYRASDNTPVYAAAAGTVHYPASIPGLSDASGWHTLAIDHGNNYITYYLHLSTHPSTGNTMVAEGQHVNSGAQIGLSGHAAPVGKSVGPHLHFEVQFNGIPVDPYGWAGAGTDPYTRATNVNLWESGSATPILSVTPASPPIQLATAGSINFAVSNMGAGTMTYTTAVSDNASWLHIASGGTGGNNGTLVISYDANAGLQRSGTIIITAPGASGSPKTVSITQSGTGGTTNPSADVVAAQIKMFANQYMIPSTIIAAIMYQESQWRQFDSSGNPLTGSTGDIGIMQINPSNPSILDPPFDTNQIRTDWVYNLETGCKILKTKKFDAYAVDTASPYDTINDTYSDILENWYYPIAWYNGQGSQAYSYVGNVWNYMQSAPSLYSSYFPNTLQVGTPRSLTGFPATINPTVPYPSQPSGWWATATPQELFSKGAYTLLLLAQNTQRIHRWSWINNSASDITNEILGQPTTSFTYTNLHTVEMLSFPIQPTQTFSQIFGSNLIGYIYCPTNGTNIFAIGDNNAVPDAKTGYLLVLNNPVSSLTINGTAVSPGVILSRSVGMFGVTQDNVHVDSGANIIPNSITTNGGILDIWPDPDSGQSLFDQNLTRGKGYLVLANSFPTMLIPGQTGLASSAPVALSSNPTTISDLAQAQEQTPAHIQAAGIGTDFSFVLQVSQQDASGNAPTLGVNPAPSNVPFGLDVTQLMPFNAYGSLNPGTDTAHPEGFKKVFYASADDLTWTVFVHSAEVLGGTPNNNPVVLSWSIPSSGVDPGTHFELLDESGNSIVGDMRAQSTYSLPVSGSHIEKHLRVHAWIPSGNVTVIQTSASTVNVPEGGTAQFQVKLSAQPAGNVTVAVARSAGDGDITVQSGSSLTFTASNWSTYQTVTLAAAEDADTASSQATITCSAPGLSSVDVIATEQDNDTGSLPSKAANPNPTNGATGQPVSTTLNWSNGGGATSYDVYFGTSNPPASKGNQVGMTYDPGTLAYSTTYYWRIDAKNTAGTTTGDVWSFTTSNPQPLGVFFDDFNDNSIDINKWTTSGGPLIAETNGELHIEENVTDCYSQATTKNILVDPSQPITITRKVKVHYGGDYVHQSMTISDDSQDFVNIWYANFAGFGSEYGAVHGIGITAGEAIYLAASKKSTIVPGVWDQWFTEQIAYDPVTGKVDYSINGTLKISYTCKPLMQGQVKAIKLRFSAYGWYTGHYQYMDDLRVIATRGKASVSNRNWTLYN